MPSSRTKTAVEADGASVAPGTFLAAGTSNFGLVTPSWTPCGRTPASAVLASVTVSRTRLGLLLVLALLYAAVAPANTMVMSTSARAGEIRVLRLVRAGAATAGLSPALHRPRAGGEQG